MATTPVDIEGKWHGGPHFDGPSRCFLAPRLKNPGSKEEGNTCAESPDCSRNSELLQTPTRAGIGRKIMYILGVLGACRSVPLAALLYYVMGACIFGVLRGLGSLETMMFPLEFTTSRHLEHIPGHVRIIYGCYIEGAMILIACAVATIRLHSSAGLTRLADKYRLFTTVD